MINFSDLTFIFRFLPVFLIAYYLTPITYRTWTLLIGSLAFYAVGDIRLFPALLGAVLVNYLFGRANFGEKKKLLLAFAVCLDALMLIEFKLIGQFINNSFLPIGISFYTFKMISYQVDIYKGKIEKEPKFVDVAAYFTMFPQVTSGPIMRYSDFEALELKEKFGDILEQIEDGLKFFVLGCGFKVLLADHFAMLWKDIGTIGYESISTPLAWIGAVTYSLQLYYDFWGYSLMAAGLGVMLGFPFITNFDQPYSSGSISEFYRRWHATLGSWFKDYIYIPLGGSRKGTGRTFLNLLVVWLITGFWHGVTLNFILWGLILFVFIALEHFVIMPKLPKTLGKIIGKINVLVFIPLTWVIFAIANPMQLLEYFKRLFPFFGEGISVNQNDFIKNLGIYGGFLAVGIILLLPGLYRFFVKNRKHPVINVFLFILFWACVFSLSNAAGNPFMYFKF